MKRSHKILRALAGAAASIALTACGGAPSDSDIKKAIENQSAEEEKNRGVLGDLLPSVKFVKKIGCNEDGENVFKCDVEVEVTQLGKTNNAIVPMRFAKGSNGWVVSR